MQDEGVEELLGYLKETLGADVDVRVKPSSSDIVNDSAIEVASFVVTCLGAAPAALSLIDRAVSAYRQGRKKKLRTRVLLWAPDGTPLRTIEEDEP